ncbi:sigma-54-dependent transcriptional regulator [Alkalitalea saponilacus]|uniref:DNA-binding transcriptional response regulator, NtrC family, contains REC, AAA-type ATPase, and a Fis-type DNA-binding domains n=1 Tax=Alkalitalea saponilacus TaxID=889453 RepID=A0A1T5BJD4_9BACT|nr:sigma-54 dependent transcriptional regulator [Alkalitalea saponilacus]ASB49666.1 sigma-54-dependent Fis family transcriptional regulator [Alkalitalea saponilacus]SKB47422.1 DNA-binding transcriptional response regulator, NtrC family, contains REC, AAA-type ATPase, and a Fis-type DNA-binding domains [Alkalitalea saponilacus]
MTSKKGKILAVDDNADILFALKMLLKPHCELIQTETNPERIPQHMAEDDYDVILLDMNFNKDAISGHEGFSWLKRILEIDPGAVVLFITAYGDVEKSVKAIKSGATDFIIKPWQNEKLLGTIWSAIKLRESRKEVSSLRERQKEINTIMDQPFADFIGVSPGMQQVFNTIKKVAGTDANVLILGENGTGKELVARALHRQSKRADEPFISVDLGALSDTLFESELFGHVKGAFTDAKTDRPGRFELASGGTIFLDEIGNLSLPLQAKLLTVLERREVTRVGANKPIPINIRLICATNMGIKQMAVEGGFRQDLLYRINTVEVDLPPLRERHEDIPLLADHFIKIYNKKYNRKISRPSQQVLRKLTDYPWPGNVREFQHVIERTIIMSESDTLTVDDFQLSHHSGTKDGVELENYNLDEVEKMIIEKVLKNNRGNISKAASDLGLTRTSLYRRMEKHGL